SPAWGRSAGTRRWPWLSPRGAGRAPARCCRWCPDRSRGRTWPSGGSLEERHDTAADFGGLDVERQDVPAPLQHPQLDPGRGEHLLQALRARRREGPVQGALEDERGRADAGSELPRLLRKRAKLRPPAHGDCVVRAGDFLAIVRLTADVAGALSQQDAERRQAADDV